MTTVRYTDSTENIPGDLGAPDLAASGSSSFWRQIDAPACSATDPDAWVPDRERSIVPAPLATLCHQCPNRTDCLAWAILSRSGGYWAATTAADRKAMVSTANMSPEFADLLQAAERVLAPTPLHQPGLGSSQMYRKRGCHCDECRAAESARQARARARRYARLQEA